MVRCKSLKIRTKRVEEQASDSQRHRTVTNDARQETYYLIGPFPPPLGGISVYLSRYAQQLPNAGYHVKRVDLGKCSRLRRLRMLLRLVFCRNAVFHLNFLSCPVILALLLNPFSPRLVFCSHGHAVDTLVSRRWKRALVSLFLRRLDECILVGAHLQESFTRHGFVLPEKTFIRPAFLPPPLEEEETILKSYEASTHRFLACRRPLIVANAFQITRCEGVDLYGLDLCVELVARLKPHYPGMGLLFALAEIGDQEYYDQIRARIIELGLDANVHFMTGQRELWPVFRQADLMLRPTYRDGYGISVAEALYLGCPAVASDVCVRTEGTVLFRNRDVDDLVAKCRAVLAERVAFRNKHTAQAG